MKQTIKYLAMLMVMLSFGLTSTSCGDDDDEGGNKENSALVGSWVWDDDEEPEIWTFNANGTFKSVYYDSYLKKDHIHTGKYRYDSTTGILLISMVCDNYEEPETWTEKYIVLSVSSLELVLRYDDEDNEIYTLNRKI